MALTPMQRLVGRVWNPRHLRNLRFLLCLVAACTDTQAPNDVDRMTIQIVTALAPTVGERAIVRHDPSLMPDLAEALSEHLQQAGAVVERIPYGPVDGFAEKLGQADIYIWLPDSTARGTTPDQAATLGAWLDAGRGRQIHFHWGGGTQAMDGLPGEHGPAYDSVYLAALEIDYQALDSTQQAAIALLRSGPVRITTPAGTDLTFSLGDRPVNQQNGDASATRMRSARIRIDREIELPAGVIRVAPVERTIVGRMVVPSVRFGSGTADTLVLEIRAGRIESYSATSGVEHYSAELETSPALRFFREVAIGFNPALRTPPGGTWLPYYGYGPGVVRLSLGNNAELGGTVTGAGVRWLFFTDATVSVGADTLVTNGVLLSR